MILANESLLRLYLFWPIVLFNILLYRYLPPEDIGSVEGFEQFSTKWKAGLEFCWYSPKTWLGFECYIAFLFFFFFAYNVF